MELDRKRISTPMNHSRLYVVALISGACLHFFGGFPASAEVTAVLRSQSTLAPSQRGTARKHQPGAGNSLGNMIRDQAHQLVSQEQATSQGETLDHRSTGDGTGGSDEASSRSRSTLAHLMRLRKPVGEIKIHATESLGRVPENKAALYSQEEPLIMITSLGTSPPLPDRYSVGFMHRPLYFEQPNLERCGRSCGYFQNAISGAQFLANTMVLPYHLGSQRADCPIAAGGDCLACQTLPVDHKVFPLNRHGFVSQSAALAGFSFLLL